MHPTGRDRPQDKLAARLFLILHDPFTGRCAVPATALRCALVGAELAELVLTRRIALENDLVVLGESGAAPGTDAISAFVVDSIARQTDAHGVPTWLAVIGNAVTELVAARLVDAGVLVRSRPLFGRGNRFPASNLLAAAGPRVRLEHVVRHPRETDAASAVCAALLVAVGARSTLNPDGHRRDTRRGLAALDATLPPDLRSLVVSVEVAHASGSLPPSLRLRPRNP